MRALVTGMVVLITFVFQVTVFQRIPLFEVKPDLAIVVVVSLSIILGKDRGAVIGLASGMLQDIMFGKPVGMTALSYMIIGYFVGINSERIFKDNIIVPVIFTLGATILRHSIFIFFSYVFNIDIQFLLYIRKFVLLEVIYNSLAVIPVYKLLQTIYHKRFIEEGFKVRRNR